MGGLAQRQISKAIIRGLYGMDRIRIAMPCMPDFTTWNLMPFALCQCNAPSSLTFHNIILVIFVNVCNCNCIQYEKEREREGFFCRNHFETSRNERIHYWLCKREKEKSSHKKSLCGRLIEMNLNPCVQVRFLSIVMILLQIPSRHLAFHACTAF